MFYMKYGRSGQQITFYKILTSVAYRITVKRYSLNKKNNNHGELPLFPNITVAF